MDNRIAMITRKLPYDSGVIVSMRHLKEVLHRDGLGAVLYTYETEEELSDLVRTCSEETVNIHVPAFSDETLGKIMNSKKRILLSIHSTICNLQAEEGMLERLFAIGMRYEGKLLISCPSRREVIGMNAFHSGQFVYLPNTFSYPLLSEEEARTKAEERMKEDVRRIGYFCAYRPFKNLPTQIAAAALINGDYKLEAQFSNGSGNNPVYRAAHTLADRAGLPSVTWPQMQNRAFYDSLDSISVLMQVSLSETLSYVALEHMARGIPVIGSASIPFATLRADYSDVTDMAEKLSTCLVPENYLNLVSQSRMKADELVQRNNAEALRVMRAFEKGELR